MGPRDSSVQSMVWLVVLAAGCHGSPAPARQPAPAASARSQPPLTDTSRATGPTPAQVAPPDAAPTVDAAPGTAHDDRPHLGEADVVFHVTNDTGADVFVDDRLPLLLEFGGKPVDLHPGCGAYCPSCACKECPSKPPRVRRIPALDTWDYGWHRRVYVTQQCGGVCPCIREIDAKPGTYTVRLRGKRGADAPPTGTPPAYHGRLDEHSVDCEATATFKLAPGAHVDLMLTCEAQPARP
jgi:hypothetical protein